MNEGCEKNKINENTCICDLSHVGYCLNNPDSAKFGTHRHYFDKPKNYLCAYRKAYIDGK